MNQQSPTGRNPSNGPNMQTVNPRTPEVRKIRDAFTRKDPVPWITVLLSRPDTMPPRDGEWAEVLLFGKLQSMAARYDATAYGGKGGWFNGRDHALKEVDIFQWRRA